MINNYQKILTNDIKSDTMRVIKILLLQAKDWNTTTMWRCFAETVQQSRKGRYIDTCMLIFKSVIWIFISIWSNCVSFNVMHDNS